jgi:hypothetical protein
VKTKSTSGRTIQVLLSIYALLYFAYLVLPLIPGLDIYDTEQARLPYKTLITFVAFLLVYLLAWRQRDIAGMLLIVGYIGFNGCTS